MQIGATTVENSMEVLQKIKTRITIWFSNSTGYLLKENDNTNLKRYMHPYVYCSIIYNSQDMEATQVSIHRWMDKEEVVYTYNEIFIYKKDKILPFATTWMDLEGIMLSEISQAE